MSDMTEIDALLDLADGVYDADTDWAGMVRQQGDAAITAGVFPVKPPASWFANPGLPGLTPLTISNTGKVFGHIAAWHTSHIGMAGGVKPPKSKSDYAFFRTGVVETDDGQHVNVGQITLAGGHAPLDATVARAVAHYDDTRSGVMDVAAGEDKHGIWVAGAMRPNVSDEDLRILRASSVSGDWRPINGKLELVAVCAVNAPGFPIPRARVASGAPLALVAAGVEPLVQIRIEDQIEERVQAGLDTFRERILHLEDTLIARGLGLPDEDEVEEDLRHRADSPPAEEDAVIAAGLRERVHSVDPRDALRRRVHSA